MRLFQKSTICLFMMLWMAASVQASELKIKFSEGDNQLSAEAVQELVAFAESNKASSNIVRLKDRAARLRAGLKDLMQVQVRTLRVFKVLVENGIDPARLVVSSPDEKPDANSVVVTTEERKPEASPSAPQLNPSSAKTAADPRDFRFYFPKSSGDPSPVNQADLHKFLSAVGSPGNDAVVIEGYTDTDGDKVYNQILSELRALRVFEMLVRTGLSASRIQPFGKGISQEQRLNISPKEMQALRRHVVVRWTRTTPLAETQAVSSPGVEKIATAEAVREELFKMPHLGIDIVPFAGVLMPLGELASHAKSGTLWGLGIGRFFWSDDMGAVRATISGSSIAKLDPKESDREGTLNIRLVTLRGDYVYGHDFVRPFVGIGFGHYLWSATIEQSSTELENTGGRSANGLLLSLGVDLTLSQRFSLVPEFSYHKARGSLNETFATGLLTARWGI